MGHLRIDPRARCPTRVHRARIAAALITAVAVGQVGARAQSPDEQLVLHYRALNAKTDSLIEVSSMTLTWTADGRVQAVWSSEAGDDVGEESLLGPDFATLSWRVRFPDNGYDYAGERRGDTVVVEGLINGTVMRKELEIDDRPFYYNWKLGIVDFVRSGEEKRKYWVFRPDNQTAYVFEAQRKEEGVLTVGGEDVSAVKIEWGLTGLRRMFYKGNQWYRADDGYFLYEERDGRIEEWIRDSLISH